MSGNNEKLHVNNHFTTRLLDFVLQRKPHNVVIREHSIPDKIDFKFRLTKDGWMVVTSPSLPGLVTEAKDAKSLIHKTNDAVLTYFDVPRRQADEVFNQLQIEGLGTITTTPKHKYQAA